MLTRLALLLLAVGLLVKAHLLIVRPWFQTWGATEEERVARLPGDEIVPHAVDQTTRAITISAPAQDVWGWVAQLGQDRGGFYSYDLLEDLVGCEMPRIETLTPELQHWKLGDQLWMYPERKLHGVGGAPLRVLEEGRVLGFATRQIGTAQPAEPDGSWSFIVQPLGADTTRLIVRGRGAGVDGLWQTLGTVMLFEPIHFAMERRMLVGIAALAGGHPIAAWSDALQVSLWTLAFAAFISSAVLVLRKRQPLRRFFTFVAAAVIFEVLTLVQPPWLVGLVLVASLFAAMFPPVHRKRTPDASAAPIATLV